MELWLYERRPLKIGEHQSRGRFIIQTVPQFWVVMQNTSLVDGGQLPWSVMQGRIQQVGRIVRSQC